MPIDILEWVNRRTFHADLCTCLLPTLSPLVSAHACRQLQHPNIVRVFGFCTTPELAIVMEYVSSGTLSSWIEAHRGSNDPLVVRQRWQVCKRPSMFACV